MSALNLWADHQQAENRLLEIGEVVGTEDLTTLEILAVIAVLEQAEARVNGHTAPVLKLIPKPPQRRPKRTGTGSPKSAS